jgi:flotillin
MQKERIQVSTAESLSKVGEADADAKANIGSAEAQKSERISVSEANARAVEGENKARVDIANSESERREKEAEALRKAVAAEKVKQAKALEEAYGAERVAERIRAERDEATQNANVIIPAKIAKEKLEIEAEAEAEMTRRKARGESDAILMKRQAEAQGIYEILTKQAEGLRQIVSAAGNSSKDAAMLIIADKLPDIVKLQSEAIKNIKVDKITVWEGGSGKDGKTSTANFISGMYQSVPPLHEIFKMEGLELPSYLGQPEGSTIKVQPTPPDTDANDETPTKAKK